MNEESLVLKVAGASPVQEAGRTWLLASPHQGDNSQLLALAKALGWVFETKYLRYAALEKLQRFLRRASLSGLEPQSAQTLHGPWPDLVLLSGRSNEAVAHWIKKQSGGRSKLVFIGTPYWPLLHYDLVIATPQYGLPDAANVVQLALPLHTVHAGTLAEARKAWAKEFEVLPRPRLAVLVGGPSGPYTFADTRIRSLIHILNDHVQASGGSVLITTSARTPQAVSDALRTSPDMHRFLHVWQPNDVRNPFLAILAFADEILVTADSISMLSEAAATGKPVHLFDIEDGAFSMRAEEITAGYMPPPGWRGRDLASTVFRLLMRFGPPRASRDLRVVHRAAVQAGLARWHGDPAPGLKVQAVAPDLAQCVLRVRQLFGL